MDIEAYFRSLSMELESQRDRVRQLIGGAHWPTDGGWKESVLRSVLRRLVGRGVDVGSGFFVVGEADSPEMDLILFRADSPVLFRDGDVVIVPAEAVLGIVEVKTRLNAATLREGITRLSDACNLARRHRRHICAGIFAYETDYATNREVLRQLRERCSDWPVQLDVITHGPDRFVRYWANPPRRGNLVYQKWHSYDMPGLSFGYFVQNFVSHVAPADIRTSGPPFYPREGKERHRDGAVYIRGSLIEALEDLRRAES